MFRWCGGWSGIGCDSDDNHIGDDVPDNCLLVVGVGVVKRGGNSQGPKAGSEESRGTHLEGFTFLEDLIEDSLKDDLGKWERRCTCTILSIGIDCCEWGKIEDE